MKYSALCESAHLFLHNSDDPSDIPVLILDSYFENNLKSTVFCYDYDVRIRKCVFRNNHDEPGLDGQTSKGVCLDLWQTDGIIDSCRFEEHVNLGEFASAIYHIGNRDTSTITITNNVFTDNFGAPAVHLVENRAVIRNNTFSGNTSMLSEFGGAAVFLNTTIRADICSNRFTGNSVLKRADSSLWEGSGGALYINNCTDSVVVANNLFAGNSAYRGGAIFCWATDRCCFINNTITGNISQLSPGVFSMAKGTHFHYNECFAGNYSIISAHTDTLIFDVYNESAVTASYRHCLFERMDTTGVSSFYDNCIFADPLFSDTAAGDYSLTGESPCVNTGNNDLFTGITAETDPAGNPRIVGDTIDIGAFEYQPSALVIKDLHSRNSTFRGTTYYLSVCPPHRPYHGFLLNGAVVRNTRITAGRTAIKAVIIRKRN